MTREQTKEAIRVMQAFVDGKEVEVLYPFTQAQIATTPAWNWDANKYRIKPTANLRPWTVDEVPLGCILKTKSTNSVWLLIGRNNVGEILIAGDNYQSPEWLLREYEHSTDGGKNWLPCGVVEEAK
jgi:hypothetical protein